MTAATLDASGLILAPMELVNALVCEYVSAGHDLEAMRHLLAFALSVTAERSLIARITQSNYVRIGDHPLTLGEAQDRIENLQKLLVF